MPSAIMTGCWGLHARMHGKDSALKSRVSTSSFGCRLGWLPVDDLQHVKNLEELHVAANTFRVSLTLILHVAACLN